ncbi:MAG: hypothetical protein OXU61_01960 [Gammaproteobacteria bacterium]|nr:hypothetical protein [Gammaproteobacteria bacterium]
MPPLSGRRGRSYPLPGRVGRSPRLRRGGPFGPCVAGGSGGNGPAC